MWLLNTETLKLEAFLSDVPSYAILSHRWENEELSFGDVTPDNQHLKGYQKVKTFCEQARRNGFVYTWVDTCCIDKRSSAELGEAINSMYMWYEQAEICYAYLYDVEGRDNIAQSSWFTRGWTLQELIAPTSLHFYNCAWSPMASKHDLSAELQEITGIPGKALQEFRHDDFCIAEKMAWAARRQTTRKEDSAYCLLGLFNVNMPMLYGEGSKAFLRLQEEIMKVSTDLSILLWQGRASAYNGMLATAPSCFEKGEDHHVTKNNFEISQGWTTNNAGISIQLYACPYILIQPSREIFCADIRVSTYFHLAPIASIFLEKLSGTQATPSYRRVTIDGKAWIKVRNPRTRLAKNSLLSMQQVFITRQALIDHNTAYHVRGCLLTLGLPPFTTGTARYGLIADHHRPLKHGPILPATDEGKSDFFFPIGPDADLSLFGHITIQLLCGANILVCLGFDRTFRGICIVLPLCTNVYEKGLEACHLSRGYHKLLSKSHELDEHFDQSCEFFAGTYTSRRGEPKIPGLDLHSIGIDLDASFGSSYHFQVTLHLDDHKLMQYCFPGPADTMSDDTTTWRNSTFFQNELEASRKRLFGMT